MSGNTMDNGCPVCGVPSDGLLCTGYDQSCTWRLEQALGDVRSVVEDLDIALSKQARIGTPGKGGLARERNPIHEGARLAGDYLGNTLTTWARDVAAELWEPGEAINGSEPASSSARILLRRIDAIRRHPEVRELLDEVINAVEQARRAVDRPADRQYLGQCLMVMLNDSDLPGDEEVFTCHAELWAKVDAHEVVCKVCGVTHPVAERRAWLLLKAADMLCTVKEASRYIGDVGGIAVTESSIRGLIHRQRLAYRVGTTTFRLGDLLEVLTDMKAKAAAA